MSIFARSIPSLTNFFQIFERTYAIVPGANVTADDSESLGSKLGFRLDLYTNIFQSLLLYVDIIMTVW